MEQRPKELLASELPIGSLVPRNTPKQLIVPIQLSAYSFVLEYLKLYQGAYDDLMVHSFMTGLCLFGATEYLLRTKADEAQAFQHLGS